MTRSLYKKVTIASLIMMVSILLSRIMGLLREMVIAYVGGTKGGVDAYQLAFVLPELLNHMVATGFLSLTFIPIFSEYLARERESEGWRVFSIILNVFGAFLAVLILAACIFTDPLMDLVAPGIEDPAIRDLAVRMTRIALPAQFFFFMGSLLMAVQFAKERFVFPALAPVIYNLSIIAGGLLLGPRVGMEGFSWGVLVGAFVGNFLVQWVGARRVGMSYQVGLAFNHPDVKRYVKLTLPLILGLTMTFSTEFFFRFFGSYLPKGSIAALNYGLRIMFLLVGLFGQAVGTATYPFMSRLVAEGRIQEANELLNRTLRYLSVVIPFAVLLMVLRHQVVFILFQRGQFDAAATALTSHLLLFLLISAFAFSAQTVVVRCYYAMQNTLLPAVVGTAAVLLSIPFYVLGMDKLGAAGVALGVSLSALLQVIVFYGIWNRRTRNEGSREVYGYVAKMAFLSLFLGIAFETLKRTVLSSVDSSVLAGNLFTSLVLGVGFFIALQVAARIMKLEEVTDLTMKLLKGFSGRFLKRKRSAEI
jgi:putative peptidoglycan lipid II flippase